MAVGSTLRELYALLVTFALLAVYVQGDAVGDLQTKGRPAVDAAIAKSTTCTKDKVKVRKEWCVPLKQASRGNLLTVVKGVTFRLPRKRLILLLCSVSTIFCFV
jgi:hypothetical protein